MIQGVGGWAEGKAQCPRTTIKGNWGMEFETSGWVGFSVHSFFKAKVILE